MKVGKAKCKHCGQRFEQGPLYRHVCDLCLDAGHSRECKITECPSVFEVLELTRQSDDTWAEFANSNQSSQQETLEEIRTRVMLERVMQFHGNMKKAAKSLGMVTHTLYHYIKRDPANGWVNKKPFWKQ